jgi:thiol-disulfide isomerase/thioredoxin
MARVVTLPASELNDLLSTSEELVILYFTGPGCPNCDFFASRLPHLLTALEDAPLVLAKVDAYAEPGLATQFGVFGIPCFVLYRQGRQLGRMREFRGDRFWLDVVREYASKPASAER